MHREPLGRAGKFWPMHDWLYRHQVALDDNALLKGAAELAA